MARRGGARRPRSPAGSAAGEEPLVTPTRVGRKDAPLVLRVWAQQDYSHLAARADVAELFRDIFQEWAEAHPDVQVEISVMPALELHKAKLLLAAAADRLPDVASVDSFWMPLFLEGGHVQPMNADWPAEDRADFLPFTIDTLSDASGNVYGLWHGTDCRVLYYRKDLVPVPPATWDELILTASRIARERKIAGYLYNAGRWEATVFDHLPMFWGQGGELVDGGGRPVFGESPHREKMLRLFAFLRRTIESGASPRSVLASNDYQQLSGAAVAGDVAMFLGGSWQLREMETNLAPDEFAKWDIAPIPQAERGVVSTGTGGWVWVTYARDPARRKAAVELIRAIESPVNVARISLPMHQLPVRKSVYRDAAFFREDRFHARYGEMLAHARARPAVPLYPAISEAAPARDRGGGGGRQDAGEGARRRVAGGAGDRGAPGGSRRAGPRSRPAIAALPDGARGRPRRRRPRARGAPGPAAVAAPRPRGRGGNDPLPDARPRAPLLHGREDARGGLPLHSRELPHARRRSRFPADGGRHDRLRPRLRRPAARDRPRPRRPHRLGASAARPGHASRPRGGGGGVGHPRRARGRPLAHPARREPRGDRELRALVRRPRPPALPVRRRLGPRLRGRGQRLAGLRVQHDPAVRRAPAHPPRAARGRGPRGLVRAGAACGW